MRMRTTHTRCNQLVPIPVGVTVCAVVYEGAGELCFFVASLHASAVFIYTRILCTGVLSLVGRLAQLDIVCLL
jgi:hypothetical protein